VLPEVHTRGDARGTYSRVETSRKRLSALIYNETNFKFTKKRTQHLRETSVGNKTTPGIRGDIVILLGASHARLVETTKAMLTRAVELLVPRHAFPSTFVQTFLMVDSEVLGWRCRCSDRKPKHS
jgi:hypothetical protein